MGLDLKLMPFGGECPGAVNFAHTILCCERRRDLFELILELDGREGQNVPTGFNTFLSFDEALEKSCYGETLETPYGERLHWVEARFLAVLASHADVLDNHLNRAVWAYLKELPPAWPVALYWC